MAPRRTIIVTLFFLEFFSGCVGRSKTPQDTVATAVGGIIQTVHPLYATDAVGQHIGELIYSPLVVINNALVPEPYLAESFRIVNDREIRFRLRPGCRLHDGTEITADIVAAAIKSFLDPAAQSPHTESLKSIKSVKPISKREFSLLLDHADPSILSYLPILKIFKNDGDRLIGSGQFQVQNFSSTEVSLIRIGNGCQPLPQFKRLVVKVVRDDLSRFLKLRNGELDIVLNEMENRKVKMVIDGTDKNLTALTGPGVGYNYIGVNFRNPVLQDRRIREALALSLDIPAIIHYKNLDYAKAATTILPETSIFSNKNLVARKRDIALAKNLLDAAGYFNGENNKPPLRLTLKTTNNGAVSERAAVLTAQAREAGIQLDHRTYEWGIFYQDVKSGNTDLYLLRWVGVTDPGIYSEVFHSKGKNNRTAYKNVEVDRLLGAAQSTLNFERRKASLDRMQTIVAQDLPYISLWHNDNAVIFRKELSNVSLYTTGSWRTFLNLKKGDAN